MHNIKTYNMLVGIILRTGNYESSVCHVNSKHILSVKTIITLLFVNMLKITYSKLHRIRYEARLVSLSSTIIKTIVIKFKLLESYSCFACLNLILV